MWHFRQPRSTHIPAIRMLLIMSKIFLPFCMRCHWKDTFHWISFGAKLKHTYTARFVYFQKVDTNRVLIFVQIMVTQFRSTIHSTEQFSTICYQISEQSVHIVTSSLSIVLRWTGLANRTDRSLFTSSYLSKQNSFIGRNSIHKISRFID